MPTDLEQQLARFAEALDREAPTISFDDMVGRGTVAVDVDLLERPSSDRASRDNGVSWIDTTPSHDEIGERDVADRARPRGGRPPAGLAARRVEGCARSGGGRGGGRRPRGDRAGRRRTDPADVPPSTFPAPPLTPTPPLTGRSPSRRRKPGTSTGPGRPVGSTTTCGSGCCTGVPGPTAPARKASGSSTRSPTTPGAQRGSTRSAPRIALRTAPRCSRRRADAATIAQQLIADPNFETTRAGGHAHRWRRRRVDRRHPGPRRQALRDPKGRDRPLDPLAGTGIAPTPATSSISRRACRSRRWRSRSWRPKSASRSSSKRPHRSSSRSSSTPTKGEPSSRTAEGRARSVRRYGRILPVKGHTRVPLRQLCPPLEQIAIDGYTPTVRSITPPQISTATSTDAPTIAANAMSCGPKPRGDRPATTTAPSAPNKAMPRRAAAAHARSLSAVAHTLVPAFGSHTVPQSARLPASPAHTVAFAYTPEMRIASTTDTAATATHNQ